MKKLIASSLVILLAAVAPAYADEAARKTELVDAEGRSVETLPLRYNFDAGWVIDNQNILYRDTKRDHYLVTLKEPCKQLDVRSRRFKFFPSWSYELRSSHDYEIQPLAGQDCDVARIEQVNDAKATVVRETAQRRIW